MLMKSDSYRDGGSLGQNDEVRFGDSKLPNDQRRRERQEVSQWQELKWTDAAVEVSRPTLFLEYLTGPT
jgi:hypothetical protein